MIKSLLRSVLQWFDSSIEGPSEPQGNDRIDWVRAIPFICMHLACIAVFWVGWSGAAIATAIGLYLLRMFTVTGFYHRYFSHRTFSTSRVVQFIFAFIGCCCVQRGPLWWAAHHRHHHIHSDQEHDIHSPIQHGFLWSHIGWFLSRDIYKTNLKKISDFSKFPELRFLNRFDIIPPILMAITLYLIGSWQLLIWGFFISTIFLYHGTFFINSLAHKMGKARFKTGDDSRNSLILALITLGEGWHNNHHHYPASTRQGFYWWEIDITYYILKGMAFLGIIWDLRPVPAHVLSKNS
jgi:stearoyl-CoA desaturase (delta-9 desaturase)